MQLRAAFPAPPRVTWRPQQPGLSALPGPSGPSGPNARAGSAFSGVVQPAFANVTVKRVDSAGTHASAINAFIESLKNAVDKAYQYALQNPGLGVLAQLDGHTAHWVNLWDQYLLTGHSTLTAAAFGYVIESLVCVKGSPYRVTPPGGYDIAFQVVKGGTRPDIVLTYNGAEVAWLDLTASDSSQHIFTQKIGWMFQTNVAEITYPSMNISTLSSVSSGVAPDFDAALIDREIRFQRYHESQLRKRFKEMGLDLKKIFVGKMPSKRNVGGDEACRKWTKLNLKARGPFHGIDLTDDQVTTILYALGLRPATYGFNGTVSQSVGEHLLHVFLNIPHVSAPPETVPFAPPGFGGFPMPQLLGPPPFQPQSFALVPVQHPQFNFTSSQFTPPQFNFNSTFGSSPPPFGGFGSPFGSGSGFAPHFPSGFQFGSPGGSQPPLHSRSPIKGPPSRRSRISAHHSDQNPRVGIKKSSRFRPSGADETLTIHGVIAHLLRLGITVKRITRAAIRFRDPMTGQMRTLTFSRTGIPSLGRRRPIWSAHSTGLPQGGGMPHFVPVPLQLPIAPTPLSPQFASIFGMGNGMSSLASAEVEAVVVEYDDDEF
ncbi:MAG: hypothetical protein BGO25_05480 [Acidobacteriales bacterium 59-55]|nr:MAG: hypothetical protein ABT04_01970 [Granulicella sp. SCN 62-9]OJV44534.1 MAG: hypothetical protein BGO25_05480 [Acidobacteriales bacterium 59-55]